MKSDSVTKVWEFYRDNCVGFKEPMRKELRKLDNYVASIEAENAKLRELVWDMWREGMCECGSLGKCATCMYEYPTRMRELGIGVDA